MLRISLLALLFPVVAPTVQAQVVWTQRSSAVSPPGRFWHAMAYDQARHRTVLFGGISGISILGDTWAEKESDPRQLAQRVLLMLGAILVSMSEVASGARPRSRVAPAGI